MMYLENLTNGIALEALYYDSRRSWLLAYGNRPELYLMPRQRWFWALRQAIDEIAAEIDSDATLLIDWDPEPDGHYLLN
ncbi:MAG TPA: hypothetical protein VMV15_05035 [Candidatus Binataceae bacterium]|nr:hypothetical protein [Candidatus Binataceae bacterium]